MQLSYFTNEHSAKPQNYIVNKVLIWPSEITKCLKGINELVCQGTDIRSN